MIEAVLLVAAAGASLVLALRLRGARLRADELRGRLDALLSQYLGGPAAGDAALWEWEPTTGDIVLGSRFLELTGHDAAARRQSWRGMLELIHPDDRLRVRTVFTDYLERRSVDCVTEFRLRCADDRYLWIQTRGVATWDRAGRARRMVGSFTDITTRVERDEQLDLLFNLSLDMFAVVGFDHVARELNPAWVSVLGWSRDDLKGRPLSEFAVAADRPRMEEALTRLAAGEPLKSLSCRFACRDGGERWLDLTAFPYPDRRTSFAVARDTTHRKEAERQRAEYRQRLQRLGDQLKVVEDRQRQELAAAIHDGLAQQLFGLRAQITLLKYPERLADYQGVVATALEVLDETMVAARSLSFELFPPVLYQVGLEAALQWLTHHYQERTGQTCVLRVEGAGDELPQDARAIAYQCVRELLTNVRKHAEAARVDVLVTHGEHEVVVEVADDGCGFDPAAADELIAEAAQESGYGLFSIRERVRSLRGGVDIASTPGAGTRVRLVLPAAAASTGGG